MHLKFCCIHIDKMRFMNINELILEACHNYMGICLEKSKLCIVSVPTSYRSYLCV